MLIVSPRVDHELGKRRVVLSTGGAAVTLRDGNGAPVGGRAQVSCLGAQ